VGAERIAMMAIQPELAQVFDVVVSGNAVEFRVEELDIHPDCSVAGETIRDSGLRQHTGALILAVEGEGDSVIVNPGPDQVLSPGERLVVVGTKDQVDRAAELLQPTQ
jgi:voltage-gated potassium channel